MAEADLRETICRIGESLFRRGYVHGTTGNISVRLQDGVLITPTDACLGTLEPNTISKVGLDGRHESGARPSKTIVLHRRIYDADPSARCTIHTHSRHLVAASMAGRDHYGDLLPPITPYFVMKVGHVPLIPYAAPGAPTTADRVHAAITSAAEAGVPIRAVMLERLGPNVWHATPDGAMAVVEELEETAFLWNSVHPEPLCPEEVQELRELFGARW